MKLHRDRPKRDLVNITPLIDVVFILLVFFMLAGAIKQPDILPVEPPKSQSEDQGDEEDLVILVGADGRVAVNNRPMEDDPHLVRTIQAYLFQRPGLEIQIKAHGDAEAARVIRVMQLLREAGARAVVLLTVGGEG